MQGFGVIDCNLSFLRKLEGLCSPSHTLQTHWRTCSRKWWEHCLLTAVSFCLSGQTIAVMCHFFRKKGSYYPVLHPVLYFAFAKNRHGIFCHFNGVPDKHLKQGKGFLTKVILIGKWFFIVSAKKQRNPSWFVCSLIAILSWCLKRPLRFGRCSNSSS